mmetsp:Transcript_19188/g.47779  ORF Transcript_19188/g.47779 Transcript_19188/m.47779 type:complete len:218 (-) Transcript_19188:2894-3547(-)
MRSSLAPPESTRSSSAATSSSISSRERLLALGAPHWQQKIFLKKVVARGLLDHESICIAKSKYTTLCQPRKIISHKQASGSHALTFLAERNEIDCRLIAEFRPRARLNAGKILSTHSVTVAAKIRVSFVEPGIEPRIRRIKAANVPPNPIKNPVIMRMRLQILGLLNMKEKQYEKEATAGPNRTRRAITADTTPSSVVVRVETSNANIRITVNQQGI